MSSSIVNIYYSFGFRFQEDANKIIEHIKTRLIGLEENFKIRIPKQFKPVNTGKGEFFFSDLYQLYSSDILISYIPEPTAGAICELAMFKTKYPTRCAIGVHCMEHDWIQWLLDYNFTEANALDIASDTLKSLILNML